MKVYSINYDLHKPGTNYPNLIKAIKENFDWWHYMDSFWLVYTSKSADGIYNVIKPHVDDNDYVLVFEMGDDRQGWLPEDAWKWIREKRGLRL